MAADEADWFIPLDDLKVRMAPPKSLGTQVKERYDGMAADGASTLCCAPGEAYSPEELASVPDWVLELSSGCGSPLAAIDLREGQTVADFGCGAGLDLLLAARRVGPSGRVIGLDASTNMVNIARRAVAELGLDNVDVRVGDLRRPPLRDGSVDVLLSNCVLSMFPDKLELLAEMLRVLKPNGYVVISDVVYADGQEVGPSADTADAADWSNCVVGLTQSQYRDLVLGAGFAEVDIRAGEPVRYRDGTDVVSAKVFAYKGEVEGSGCC